MLKYWLGIVGLFVWVGCSTSFTPQEVKVIKEGGGIMRVWKTDNREDSLFLRQQAIESVSYTHLIIGDTGFRRAGRQGMG